jgi:hypothetical protein
LFQDFLEADLRVEYFLLLLKKVNYKKNLPLPNLLLIQ